MAKWQTASPYSVPYRDPLCVNNGEEEEERGVAPLDATKEHQSSFRGESVGVLGATWGCDGLDAARECLGGRKAHKQIKRG